MSLLAIGVLTGCSGDLTVPGGGPAGDPEGPSSPALLQVVAGDDQRAETGAVLDQPLTVRVVDDSARPVAGVAVRFGFLGEAAGAALDPDAVLSDTEGRAAAIVRLGDTPGEQLIIAAVDNTLIPALRTTFTATALPAHGGGHGHDKDHESD
jgi:hypothetical protein